MKQGPPVGNNNFNLMTFILEFDLFFENFSLAKNFWIVSARASIFHMSITCDKIILLVLNLLTLTLVQLKKRLWSHLLKNKKLELPYCTWSFIVKRSFYWYQNICPCELSLRWNWALSGALCFTISSFSLLKRKYDYK